MLDHRMVGRPSELAGERDALRLGLRRHGTGCRGRAEPAAAVERRRENRSATRSGGTRRRSPTAGRSPPACATIVLISRSSTARSCAGVDLPAARARAGLLHGSVRSRLPTMSARNGGRIRCMASSLRSLPRTIVAPAPAFASDPPVLAPGHFFEPFQSSRNPNSQFAQLSRLFNLCVWQIPRTSAISPEGKHCAAKKIRHTGSPNLK